MKTVTGKYTTAIIYTDNVDSGVYDQINEMVNNPAINGPVRIMPDVHVGKGSVVGFTMPITDKVIPNVVGVDIGCGMLSFSIGKDLPYSVEEIDKIIRTVIPMGFNIRDTALYEKDIALEKLSKKVGTHADKMYKAVGTLGGGNHFIELGRDEEETLWFTIHSGSRRFGLDVCNYHQKKADTSTPLSKEDINKLKKKYTGKELGAVINALKESAKSKGYLEGNLMYEYLMDMLVAQAYAQYNRTTMMSSILGALNLIGRETLHSIHNFIGPDNIIRKGATSAYRGDVIILPFNRQDGIWIMEGLGNNDWNYSAPHGAGRTMSRSQAKRELNPDEVKQGLIDSGIYSSNDPIDEAPGAYKNPEEIKRLIQPTAGFRFSIKPILNIKA